MSKVNKDHRILKEILNSIIKRIKKMELQTLKELHYVSNEVYEKMKKSKRNNNKKIKIFIK